MQWFLGEALHWADIGYVSYLKHICRVKSQMLMNKLLRKILFSPRFYTCLFLVLLKASEFFETAGKIGQTKITALILLTSNI